MSDVKDASEFAELVKDAEVKAGTRRSRASEGALREFFNEYESEPTPGQPSQYSLYKTGYKATTPTIQRLNPGTYDIRVDDNGYFVTPLPPPSGLLLELPEMRSKDVLDIVDKFWDSERDYKEGNEYIVGGASFKAGLMLYGPPGCHAKGTEILMYDGSIKKVEDIIVGDKLMGPDSESRTVLELKRGREEMVKIIPTKGESFVVNKSHILHLTPSGEEVLTTTPVNMSFNDFLKQKNNFKERYKLTRTGVEFSQKELIIPPYILGLWLGDGSSDRPSITTMDEEIARAWTDWATKIGMNVTINSKENTEAMTYTISSQTFQGPDDRNVALNFLRYLNVINNKHIPQTYLTSTRKDRLDLLAGLLDTDGYSSTHVYDIIQKNELLADQIVYLARSLGFAAYKTKSEKYCMYKGIERRGTYYRISISGDCSEIPVKIPRKLVKKRQQIKSVLRTGFTYELLSEDDFYGFTLNKDHLYLTSDFTVHHNSGKSSIIKLVSKKLVERGGLVFFASIDPFYVLKWLTDFSLVETNRKSIVILEDIDSLIQNHGEAVYLEMLDSAKTIDNILFIATTNYPENLDPRIYNRPGRFSHIVKVGYPTPLMREAYLKAVLKKHDDVDYIVKNTDRFTIDHLSALVNGVYREKRELDVEIERLKALFRIEKSTDDNKGMGII